MLPLRYGLKQAAKVAMHQRLESGEEIRPVLIAASGMADAEWEDEKEFRLQGQMYDVVGIEYRDGLKYYRCVADALETRMEHTADDIAFHLSGYGRNKTEHQIAKVLSDWLQGLYFHTTQHLPGVYFAPGAGKQFFIASAEGIEDPFLRRIIIPPEV